VGDINETIYVKVKIFFVKDDGELHISIG